MEDTPIGDGKVSHAHDAIISDFNAQTFGIRNMGRIQGICFLVGAGVNLVQAPLVAWTVGPLEGDCTPLLGLSLAAAAPLPVTEDRGANASGINGSIPYPRREAYARQKKPYYNAFSAKCPA